MSDPAESRQSVPAGVDYRVPNSARITNYWLGGKDNYAADREAGERYREAFPDIVTMSRTGRGFLGRAVRTLVDAGVRQFLDIGPGLPTANNTHEIAQGQAPESRVVYVDNDPLVLAHARALLTGTAAGAVDYLEFDLHQAESVIAEAKRTLDFTEPIGLILMGVLGHFPADHAQARGLVDRYLDALPSGSYLLIGDGTTIDTEQVAAQQEYNDTGAQPYHLRTPEQLADFFVRLEFMEPGLVPAARWPDPAVAAPETVSRCGVARTP